MDQFENAAMIEHPIFMRKGYSLNRIPQVMTEIFITGRGGK